MESQAYQLEQSATVVRVVRPWRLGMPATSPVARFVLLWATSAIALLVLAACGALGLRWYRDGQMGAFWFTIALDLLMIALAVLLPALQLVGQMIDEISAQGIRQHARLFGVTLPMGRVPWAKVVALELVPGQRIAYTLSSGAGWVAGGVSDDELQEVYARAVAWRSDAVGHGRRTSAST